MKLQTWHRQNFVQKFIMFSIEPFLIDKEKIEKLHRLGIKTFTPRSYIIKKRVMLTLIVISFGTPGTTSPLVLISRWVLR